MKNIKDQLIDIGLSPMYHGFSFWMQAIEKIFKNSFEKITDIYNEIANENNTTRIIVEKNMRICLYRSKIKKKYPEITNKKFLNMCDKILEKPIKILDINEINRLQRAAKNKDKNAIIKWGTDFEKIVNDKYYNIYKKEYTNWLDQTFKDLDVAICFSLHNNELTQFGNEELTDFMNDLAETMKCLYKRQYSRKEYLDMLIKDGISLNLEVFND